VAELRPIPASALSAQALIDRRRGLPALDPSSLRGDIDRRIDSRL